MMYRSLVLTAALVIGIASSAQADLIVFNPNDYEVGTDVSELLPWASIAGLHGPNVLDPIVSPVLVQSTVGWGQRFDTLTLPAGNNPQGYFGCLKWPEECRHFGVTVLTFDAPTSFVQITGIESSDPILMYAFDVSGNRIATCYEGDDCIANVVQRTENGGRTMLSYGIEREQRDIARIIYGAHMGRAEITEIRYRVPEPSTLLLMGLGTALLVRRRKRVH